jgi:ElaB/YqjD/DUF883 family membrane-anchored ribosome-binding protein
MSMPNTPKPKRRSGGRQPGGANLKKCDMTDQAIDDAVFAARNMKDEAEGTIEHYRNQIEQFQSDFMSEVQDRPLRTLGVVAVLGFLIGAVWNS